MNGPAASMQGPLPVVLVVTHHAHRLLHLQRLFRTQQMQVITAVDGADGLRAAAEHLPDAVVAEAHMPLLDGYALASILQGTPNTAEIPVLLLAGPSMERPEDWRRFVPIDALLDERDSPDTLAWTVRDALHRRKVSGARAATRVPTSARGPITELVARDVIRAEIGKLARFTGVGNRHQMARAMFDVLGAAIAYRAAGVYFLQPNYATFFLHTRESLPSDQVNGLLAHAVAPLGDALQGAIRLELFSGHDETPRELGRWTPRALSVPASLHVLARQLHWVDETLGTLVALPAQPDDPCLDMLLRDFAEHFAPVLAGLYLFEECRRRAAGQQGATPANEAPERHTTGAAARTEVLERLLRGEFGPLKPAQHRALLDVRGDADPAAPMGSAGAAGRREPIDPRALVYELCARMQPMMQEKHLRFEARLPPTVPTLLLDREAMAGVLTHLLRNAASYTAPGGEVTLWVVVEREQVRIAVRDSGVGIDPARLGELFTPSANGAGGHGSGLRHCLAIVEAHGGAVQVESTPGKGSLFVIGLPLREAGAT